MRVYEVLPLLYGFEFVKVMDRSGRTVYGKPLDVAIRVSNSWTRPDVLKNEVVQLEPGVNEDGEESLIITI